MAKELNFAKNAQDKWEASFTTSGDIMGVEVNRVGYGPLVVSASIEGMKKVLIHDFGPNGSEDLIFDVDLPEDFEVTIVSFTEVIEAKVTGS